MPTLAHLWEANPIFNASGDPAESAALGNPHNVARAELGIPTGDWEAAGCLCQRR